MTKTYAVIGDPIDHSLSPLIHNAAFRSLNLDSTYIAYRIQKNELEVGIDALKKIKIAGFNVTIPHKTEILSYLDHINPRAKEIGAVNCVLNRNNKLWGFNTDWYGFSMLLKNNRVDISGKSILILGAGGVAYSVLYSLISANAGKIFINNRTHKNTIKLIDNGLGFEFSASKNFFDPYVSNKTSGTGLGLSIVKKIIEDHKGQITLSNNKNTPGACIKIVFPLSK